jgi:hypothetical protein
LTGSNPFLHADADIFVASTCHGQKEGGVKEAMFILENGATLSNVILGPNNGEGIHCQGTCTLNNIWWLDVCEGKLPRLLHPVIVSDCLCQMPQLSNNHQERHMSMVVAPAKRQIKYFSTTAAAQSISRISTLRTLASCIAVAVIASNSTSGL